MADRPFRNPLLAKLDMTSHYTIRSAWEGLEYLLNYWRADHNASYTVALQVCRDAVDGWISPERAREVLRRALDDASLSISKSRRSSAKLRSKSKNVRPYPVSSEQLASIQSSIVTGKRNERKTIAQADKAPRSQPRIDADHRRSRQLNQHF